MSHSLSQACEYLPITAKYLKSITQLIEGGFFLSSSMAFSEHGETSCSETDAASSIQSSSSAAIVKSSVLGFLCPSHALVRAAIGILRTGKALVEEFAETSDADMPG